MASIPKLNHAIDRFNQGCSFYIRASKAFEKRDLTTYENSLRTAATEVMGALEWVLKIYLRHIRRSALSNEDASNLKQPNFNELMSLMEQYADPPIDETLVSNLYSYRESFRNAAEHDGAIPPMRDLGEAIREVRDLMVIYLPGIEGQLKDIGMITHDLLVHLRSEYFDSIKAKYNFMDLGGISPKVGSRIVKIRMEDLFIPLQLMETESLFDDAPGGDLNYRFDLQRELVVLPVEEGTGTDLEIGEDSFDSETILTESLLQRMGRVSRSSERYGLPGILSASKLVILGHPGSGKTTIGKYIAYSLASGNLQVIGKQLQGHIPVLFKASEYALALKANESTSIYSFLVELHTQKYGRLIDWALDSGTCVTIIDGLDEIADPRLRVLVGTKVEHFVREFQNNRFVVTSRIVGYTQNQMPSDFVHARVMELNGKQIQNFLAKWYKAIEDESESQLDAGQIEQRANELWTTIESKPGILKLARNPLLLTIISLANWRGTKLPNKRVELYQIATETLIENWPLKQRGISIDSDEILAILEPVAYEILRSGTNNIISQYELRPLFEKQVCEVKGARPTDARSISRELLQTIEVDTGFFLQKGHDQQGNNVYGFLHQTFAEYLAARYLAERWSASELDLRGFIHDPQWHEVILLMAGHVGTWAVNQALRLLGDIRNANSEYEHLLYRDLFLTSEILSDNVRIPWPEQEKIIEQLLSIALNTQHRRLWNKSIWLLRKLVVSMGLERILDKLLSTKVSTESGRRQKVYVELELKRDLSDTLALTLTDFLTLGGFGRTILPLETVTGILSSDGPDENLLVFEESDSMQFVKVSEKTTAWLDISRLPIGDADSLLDSDTEEIPDDGPGRLWLLRSDRMLKKPTAEILDLLFTSRNTRYGFVLFDVVSIKKTAWIGIIDEAMEMMLEHDNINAAWLTVIIDLLSRPFSRTGRSNWAWTPRLRSVWKVEHDPEIRSLALRLLSLVMGEESLSPILKDALSDPSSTVRLAALNLLVDHGGQRMRSVLSEDGLEDATRAMLADDDADVRRLAARLLLRFTKYSSSEVETLLDIGYATDLVPIGGDIHFRDFLLLLETLRRSTSARVTEMLCEQLQVYARNPNLATYVPSYLLDPLGGTTSSLNCEKLKTAVRTQMADPDPKMRINAITLWGFIDSYDEVTMQIRSLLADSDENVVSAAIFCLDQKTLQNQDILISVLECLESKDAGIRDSAAIRLPRVRRTQVAPIVVDHVLNILKYNSVHPQAYSILWDVIVQDSDEYWDDVPF